MKQNVMLFVSLANSFGGRCMARHASRPRSRPAPALVAHLMPIKASMSFIERPDYHVSTPRYFIKIRGIHATCQISMPTNHGAHKIDSVKKNMDRHYCSRTLDIDIKVACEAPQHNALELRFYNASTVCTRAITPIWTGHGRALCPCQTSMKLARRASTSGFLERVGQMRIIMLLIGSR